ncbi:MAG TPA: multiheme c-type cytochrome [Pyrinomonadaceae bacterium]|nr:multiheme c-type cytochrome [Pyrinomonadaceae bacterium]
MKSKGHKLGKNVLRLACAALYLLLLGWAGSWATSNLFGQQQQQQSASVRWHPRRAPANAQFIGDQACAQCHKKMVSLHAQSAMGMAMEPVANSKVLIDNPVMTFRTGPYTYEIRRKEKESSYTVTDGKETITLPILYAFGQGKAGQTYVLRHEGAYYESLVSYYNEVQGLDFTIGAPRTVPESLMKALGRKLSENEVGNCFSCHSTGGVVAGKLNLEKMTPGIRCEGCHGPGGAHAGAAKEGEPSDKLIYNPSRLSGDQLTQDFCASCHRGNDEFGVLQTMEINNVRFQPYRIFHSKCYSDDKRISCTACHDPHQPLVREVSSYDAKCLACHSPKDQAADAKAKPAATAHDATTVCKVSTKDCVTCHMPKIGPPAAHFKFTDHFIRVVKPDEVYPN